MTKEQLIAAIQTAIKTNGSHDITGSVLQNILTTMVNTIYDAMPSPSGEPTYKGKEGSVIVQDEKKKGVASEMATLTDNGLEIAPSKGSGFSTIILYGGQSGKTGYKVYVDNNGEVTAEAVE